MNLEVVTEEFLKELQSENYEMIKKYLEAYPILVNYDNGYYFETVAKKGNLDLIKLFVEFGADITIDNNYILYECSYNQFYDCVKYLIEIGADVESIKYTTGYKYASFVNNRILQSKIS
jgi:hypothetical protein